MTKPPVLKSASCTHWTEKWDRWALRPLTAIPLFLLVMYGVFVFSIGIGGIFQDFFDLATQAFVTGLVQAWPLTLPNWLHHLIQAFSQGAGLTASFIPVLMGLFMGLGALEQSGYMARVACIAEKLTRWVGLPGKAFVPLLVGFGCNVPAIMGTRILHNTRDRILTIMMLPFMSCGARLAIYALFVSAFFADSGYHCIFMLYLIGILAAVFTILVFKHAWFQGVPSGLHQDHQATQLPPYQWPNWGCVFRQSARRVKNFIKKVGLLIMPCCLLLGSIEELKSFTGLDIEWAGRKLTPIFKPLGIEEDNWPATVGLLAGVFAKEVMVGSLGTLYQAAQEDKVLLPDQGVAKSVSFVDTMAQAISSVGNNAQELGKKLFSPWDLTVKLEKVQPETQGIMAAYFTSQVAAFAYLLFVLLYFPCISVVVVIAKELNRYWATLSVLWSTGLAYVVSVVFYQSFQWLVSRRLEALEMIGMAFALLAIMLLSVYGLGWWWGRQRQRQGKSIAVKLVCEP